MGACSLTALATAFEDKVRKKFGNFICRNTHDHHERLLILPGWGFEAFLILVDGLQRAGAHAYCLTICQWMTLKWPSEIFKVPFSFFFKHVFCVRWTSKLEQGSLCSHPQTVSFACAGWPGFMAGKLAFGNGIQKFINLKRAVGHKNQLIISQQGVWHRQSELLKWPGSPTEKI